MTLAFPRSPVNTLTSFKNYLRKWNYGAASKGRKESWPTVVGQCFQLLSSPPAPGFFAFLKLSYCLDLFMWWLYFNLLIKKTHTSESNSDFSNAFHMNLYVFPFHPHVSPYITSIALHTWDIHCLLAKLGEGTLSLMLRLLEGSLAFKLGP